jgi:hypothetical protein
MILIGAVIVLFANWYINILLLFDPDIIKFLDDIDEGIKNEQTNT